MTTRSRTFALVAALVLVGTTLAHAQDVALPDIEPVKPTKYQLSIPHRFELCVMKMLAKRPEDRFQTASDLLKELNAIGKLQKQREVLGPQVELLICAAKIETPVLTEIAFRVFALVPLQLTFRKIEGDETRRLSGATTPTKSLANRRRRSRHFRWRFAQGATKG